jgi:hypothetical protein
MTQKIKKKEASVEVIKLIRLRRRGLCSTYGGDKKLDEILFVIPEEEKPLRRPGHRWKVNIQIYFR